jgi:hypothetical protein
VLCSRRQFIYYRQAVILSETINMILDSASEAELSFPAMETSREYVGRWNRLVSTTNWEKGRIITQWREAMREEGAPVAGCTDEAWAEQVGGVTPQHVGRLRRVHERFADVHENYSGLYWSHFFAALDWDDAEMWLEGAVQSGWSIAEMRDSRWKSLGAPAELKPKESEIYLSARGADDEPSDDAFLPESVSEILGVVHDAGGNAERLSHVALSDDNDGGVLNPDGRDAEGSVPFRPFENLPQMPADMREAFELFKLSVIAHKLSGWKEIAMKDVIVILDALKQLVRASAE